MKMRSFGESICADLGRRLLLCGRVQREEGNHPVLSVGPHIPYAGDAR